MQIETLSLTIGERKKVRIINLSGSILRKTALCVQTPKMGELCPKRLTPAKNLLNSRL